MSLLAPGVALHVKVGPLSRRSASATVNEPSSIRQSLQKYTKLFEVRFPQKSVPAATVRKMNRQDLFLMSDAALRDVIDMIDLDQLSLPTPAHWSRKPNPTLRDVLAAHAYDEAWVPDVLAGRTAEEVGARYDGDLLGGDPIGNYDALNDAATEAVSRDLNFERAVHVSYGELPLGEYLLHISIYRAFQAWSIAHLLGLDFALPEPLVDGLWENLGPRVDEFRGIGIFPPEVEAPTGADSETRLLARVGFLVP
jgi:hypothetical protein